MVTVIKDMQALQECAVLRERRHMLYKTIATSKCQNDNKTHNTVLFNPEMWTVNVNKLHVPSLLKWYPYHSEIPSSYSFRHKILNVTKNTVRYNVIWSIKSWSS